MRIFAENSNTMIDQFSSDFEKGYLDVLSHRHGTKRVQANRVYQEYIADKHHIHMNSTMWTSLSEFVKYLGREGKCVVDETEKGWFVTYIDRDPKLIAKQAAAEQRQKHELDEEQRVQRAIEQQIAAAKEKEFMQQGASETPDEESNVSTDLVRDESTTKIALSLKTGAEPKKRTLSVAFAQHIVNAFDQPHSTSAALSTNAPTISSSLRPEETRPVAKRAGGEEKSHASQSSAATSVGANQKKPLSAIEELMLEQEKRKQQQQLQQKHNDESIKDYWLHPGIVVKILSKKLAGGKFYKSKAVVMKVLDRYVGEVCVEGCGTVVRIDQEDLETVIPKVRTTAKVHYSSQSIVFPSFLLLSFLPL